MFVSFRTQATRLKLSKCFAKDEGNFCARPWEDDTYLPAPHRREAAIQRIPESFPKDWERSESPKKRMKRSLINIDHDLLGLYR